MQHKNFRTGGQGAKLYVLVAFALAGLATAVLGGCAAVGGPGDAGAENREQALTRVLVEDGLGGVEVVVEDGEAVLLGRVPDSSEAERALQTVRQSAPHLRVRGVLPAEDELAACPPSRDRELFGRLAAQVYAAMPAPRVVVRVVGCRAILLGRVADDTQARTLRNAAAGVGPVVDFLRTD